MAKKAITITLRHNLSRVDMLNYRDVIVELLAAHQLAVLEMTSDGTEVFMRTPDVPHFLDIIAKALEEDPTDVADVRLDDAERDALGLVGGRDLTQPERDVKQFTNAMDAFEAFHPSNDRDDN